MAAALCASGPALSQPAPVAPPPPTAAFQSAFDDWVQKYKPQTAIAMVQIAGRPVFSRGFNANPDAPTLIGSMSKAVTGACIATLIGEGKLSFTTPMKDAMPGYFRNFGPPADTRLMDVTVEQLLAHRSGLPGNSDGDPIHGIFRKRAEAGLGGDASPGPLLQEHFRRKLARDPGSAFSYGNTNYIALAQIIEEKSGRPYEDFCRAAVFDKLGIRSARLHSDWRLFSGAGGWTITPADYMTFLKIFDPAHPFLPQSGKDWIDSAKTKWKSEGTSWYSLGVNTHAVYGRWFVMHGGLLNSQGRDKDGRPTTAIISSNAIRAADGTSLIYAMTPSKDANAAMGELRKALDRAIDAARAKRS